MGIIFSWASKHDLYISASINEPAGMHHIEGLLCGLPIIYRDNGALPIIVKILVFLLKMMIFFLL